MLAHVAENRRITKYINNDSQKWRYISTGPFWRKDKLENSALRSIASAAMPSHNKIAEQQTGNEQADERVPAPPTQDRRTSLGAGWSAACSEAPAQASSALGRQDFLSMPPPQAIPATKRPPPVLHAPRYPAKSSPSAPGTLGVSPSGVPGMGAPGPSFGGSYTPESVAGSVFSHTGLRRVS